jgi:hypothetical protein
VTFSVQVTGGLGPLVGGSLGTASLDIKFPSQSTTNPDPITLQSVPAIVSFPDIHLPAHAAGGVVKLTVSDNAGNFASQVWNILTDVIPPGSPSVTAAIKSAHAATIGLTWNATGDDGLAGGPVAGYDLRWSTTLNPLGDDQFFDGGMKSANTGLGGAQVGTPQSYDLTVTPLNSYFVALRAVDAVGNRSALAATPVANPWKKVTISAPSVGATSFGWRVESGDFNGDGATDLAVSDPFYGGAASVSPS